MRVMEIHFEGAGGRGWLLADQASCLWLRCRKNLHNGTGFPVTTVLESINRLIGLALVFAGT